MERRLEFGRKDSRLFPPPKGSLRCILEIHAAVSAGIPIVGCTLRGKGYDHSEAQNQLTFLDTALEQKNPGASAVLRQNGLDPRDAKNFHADPNPPCDSRESGTLYCVRHLTTTVEKDIPYDPLCCDRGREVHTGTVRDKVLLVTPLLRVLMPCPTYHTTATEDREL